MRKSVVVFVLVIALLLLNVNSAFALDSHTDRQEFIGDDGSIWTLLVTENGDDKVISLSSNVRSADKFVIETDSVQEELTLTKYEYEGGVIKPRYSEEAQTFDLSEIDNDSSTFDTFAQAYNPVVYEAYKSKYWYRTSKTTNPSYLQIGCVATYTINYTALSSAKQSKCDKYKSKIRSVTSYYNKSVVATSATLATVGVALAVGLLGGPVGAAIAAIVAAIGCSVVAANYMNDAAEAYGAVQDYYSIIKAYA
jgi:hypothetical protein